LMSGLQQAIPGSKLRSAATAQAKASASK
jgi:hypothetical protein